MVATAQIVTIARPILFIMYLNILQYSPLLNLYHLKIVLLNFGKKNKERIRLLRLIPLLYGDNHIFSLTEAILLSNILYVNSPIFFHLIYYQHFCIIIHYKYAILNLFTFYKISEFSTLFYILVYFNAHKYTCSFHIDVFLFILYFFIL